MALLRLSVHGDDLTGDYSPPFTRVEIHLSIFIRIDLSERTEFLDLKDRRQPDFRFYDPPGRYEDVLTELSRLGSMVLVVD